MIKISLAVLLVTLGALVGADSVQIARVENVSESQFADTALAATPIPRREVANGQIQYTLGVLKYPAKPIYSNYYKIENIPGTIQVSIKYNGGRRVHYVRIRVIQTNNSGEGYVLTGGIGRSTMELLITAKDVPFMLFEILFYTNDI